MNGCSLSAPAGTKSEFCKEGLTHGGPNPNFRKIVSVRVEGRSIDVLEKIICLGQGVGGQGPDHPIC